MNTRQLRRVGDRLSNETAIFREINPQHPELIPIFSQRSRPELMS